MSRASQTREYAIYVRQQIAGDDFGFRRDNRDWNPERPEHVHTCLGTVLSLLTPEQFIEFHRTNSVSFNELGEAFEACSGNSQSWYDQPGNVEKCMQLLDSAIGQIVSLLNLVERV
jgi:hypothetical protein